MIFPPSVPSRYLFTTCILPFQENLPTKSATPILFRLFNLLQKSGRKSDRYEKKTISDILGIVYNFAMSQNHVA